MYELHNYLFVVEMHGGYRNDIWALSGNVFGNPRFNNGEIVTIGTPIHFDEVECVVRTGRSQYKLIHPAGNPDEIHEEIRQTIKRGGYERC